MGSGRRRGRYRGGKTCLDAIRGNIPAKVARAALIRAAEEAGVPVVATVH
ncbi:DUF982 domain-containing protein (plasmid) [Rhizobium acidisoli]|uniref:DUF982 domain-containing protein n=1 Tax=Rhizobium acidisoli TaxID=1538158 RepID=A0AAE5WTY3_9HYPH|nr:DUF982 domain-containing protein [Rhizobium acidisoli]